MAGMDIRAASQSPLLIAVVQISSVEADVHHYWQRPGKNETEAST
jgi:hypothetical protein